MQVFAIAGKALTLAITKMTHEMYMNFTYFLRRNYITDDIWYMELNEKDVSF